MFVKPLKGRSVPDPARNDFLPESGRNVESSAYWYRRQADGDIKIVAETKAEAAPEAPEGGKE